MYRELDQRISDKEVSIFGCSVFLQAVARWVCLIFDVSLYQRSSFGFAQRMHLYYDCSILVCNYLANGTLQVRQSYQILIILSSTCHSCI